MTPAELIRVQLDDAEFKITKAYEGITTAEVDLKSCPSAMTPREIAVHLDECYQCVVEEAAGGKYKWGSHKPSSTDWPGLFEEMMGRRQKACEACLSEGEKGLRRAIDYIIAHDHYHVGQLCLTRLEGNPDWNPYSIYDL